MKIRHKQSGVELEGEFCDCAHSGTGIPSRSYFSDIHSGSLYDKVCWEAVPEWVNVTEECTVLDSHRGLQLYHGKEDVLWANGYRFRKVRLFHVQAGIRDAFIVERKA